MKINLSVYVYSPRHERTLVAGDAHVPQLRGLLARFADVFPAFLGVGPCDRLPLVGCGHRNSKVQAEVVS